MAARDITPSDEAPEAPQTPVVEAPATFVVPAPDVAPTVPAPVVEETLERKPEWDNDRVGCVVPGDVDGLATIVVRSLGLGDSGIYGPDAVAAVKARQAEAGLEPDGVVVGKTWALVLNNVPFGAMGFESIILRRVLGLDNDALPYDMTAIELVRAAQEKAGLPVTGVVDRDTWTALLTSS